MQMTTKKPDLDKIDRLIITALAQDGRRSLRDIARAVDVSEGTVRARLARLQEDKVTVVGNPLALGVGVGAMILLRVAPGQLRRTAETITGFTSVRFVALSFGRGDLIIQTLHKGISELHEFVSETLPNAAPAITSTETLQLAEVMKSSWHWGDWFDYMEDDAAPGDADTNPTGALATDSTDD
jgi:Lrp/AsnC family transcriptional regulator for asnA, asnC and gidA